MPDSAKDSANGQQRKAALLDSLHLIPKYSGDADGIDFENFVDTFNNVAGHLEWNNEEKFLVLKMRVRGRAAQILKAQATQSFEEMLEILKNRFLTHESPDLALTRFLAFKQEVGTSVQDFFEQAMQLSKRTLIVKGVDPKVAQSSRDSLLHSMLLANLLPAIRRGVITKDPQTPEEILKFALLEEKACLSTNPFFPTTTDFGRVVPQPEPNFVCSAQSQMPIEISNEISTLKEQIALLTAKFDSVINMQMPSNPQPNQNSITCYCCSMPGHIARQCPNATYYMSQPEYNYQNFRGRGNYHQRGNFSNFRENRNRNQQHQSTRGRQNARGRGALNSNPTLESQDQGN